jgi:glucose/arabinose dehydrogenase
VGRAGARRNRGFLPDLTHINAVAYNAELDQIMLSPRYFSQPTRGAGTPATREPRYGWQTIAYETEYDGRPINGGKTAQDGMEQPVYYWNPAIAPSGIVFYSAALIPEWKGNLFVAAIAGQHVARLVLEGHSVNGEERLLLDQHQRMRNVKQGPDGALRIVTDGRDGRLIRVAARKP